MVQRRLLRRHHHHVLHLLHDDCVQHNRCDHVLEILRLLTRPSRRGCLAALPHFLPSPHERLRSHHHHLATDSHP